MVHVKDTDVKTPDCMEVAPDTTQSEAGKNECRSRLLFIHICIQRVNYSWHRISQEFFLTIYIFTWA